MLNHTTFHAYVVSVPSLPDPVVFAKGAWDLAFPQIVAFCSAVTGLILIGLILKAFRPGS